MDAQRTKAKIWRESFTYANPWYERSSSMSWRWQEIDSFPVRDNLTWR